MPLILKRIMLNGLPAAAILAVIGYGYAELAGVFLLANPTGRTFDGNIPAPAEDPVAADLKYRIPAMMALWGFAFIAAGEGVMAIWRRRPLALPAKSAQDKPNADTTPSPSAASAENSPVFQ